MSQDVSRSSGISCRDVEASPTTYSNVSDCMRSVTDSRPIVLVLALTSSHCPDIHEGTPIGSMEVLHGLQTYVSNPKTPSRGKIDTIIMIPDIFGIYVNAKLLCDEWAGQGYRVVMPDPFMGEPVPTDMLNVSLESSA